MLARLASYSSWRHRQLWAEVTLPRKGPPRPIRLGVKKGGLLTPLDSDEVPFERSYRDAEKL